MCVLPFYPYTAGQRPYMPMDTRIIIFLVAVLSLRSVRTQPSAWFVLKNVLVRCIFLVWTISRDNFCCCFFFVGVYIVLFYFKTLLFDIAALVL